MYGYPALLPNHYNHSGKKENGMPLTKYGVQIISMSPQANDKYRRLILDYCEKMKETYKA